MKEPRAKISHISYSLPEAILTNEALAAEYDDWDVKKIFLKTGISERHIAAADECASDLGIAAAKKLFQEATLDPAAIDFLLFCTETPDYFLPASSCIMQDRLGLRTDCGALDFNLGCSGFVYGLAIAKGMIENNLAENVLLITADTYSKLIHPQDRSVRTLFGDGAAATLIVKTNESREFIGPFVFGTDGQGSQKLIVPAGGFRLRSNEETSRAQIDAAGNMRALENLFMDGPEIFNFSLKEVPKAVTRLLAKVDLTIGDIDYYVFHQANRFMLEHLRKKLKIPAEKFCINMESYGNTVSATIPMALALAQSRGEIATGNLIMLVGFGVGYSWAATLVRI